MRTRFGTKLTIAVLVLLVLPLASPGTAYAARCSDPGDNIVACTNGDDVLYGYAGDDYMYGRDGSDSYYGGDGADPLDEGVSNGADELSGNAAGDRFYPGIGTDYIYGGDGNDYVRADYDDGYYDRVYGQANFDTCYGDVEDYLYCEQEYIR